MPDQATTIQDLSGDGLNGGSLSSESRSRAEARSLSEPMSLPGPQAANRHRLPDERPVVTHHFAVGGHEG
jgi:hypothetical protein